MQMRHTTPTSLRFILLLPLLFHTSSSLAPIRGILIKSLTQMAAPSEPFTFLNPSFSVTLAPAIAVHSRGSPQECIARHLHYILTSAKVYLLSTHWLSAQHPSDDSLGRWFRWGHISEQSVHSLTLHASFVILIRVCGIIQPEAVLK